MRRSRFERSRYVERIKGYGYKEKLKARDVEGWFGLLYEDGPLSVYEASSWRRFLVYLNGREGSVDEMHGQVIERARIYDMIDIKVMDVEVKYYDDIGRGSSNTIYTWVLKGNHYELISAVKS